MVLAGRYELLEQVGEGGTAEVFRARDHRLDRIVAVKVLRPEFGQDATARTRFAVEARSAAALNVPNIVPVYDFGAADDGSLFIVMRYIDGPSLRRVLAERSALPTAAVLDLGHQIATALAEAHAHGLIHRDVKPGNILIDREGTAHLTDFGTVKALAGSDDLTRSGTIFGTAAYLSPEQATGGIVSPRTDLYALGVVLYEALSGRPPFKGDDPVAISYRHAHEPVTPLGALLPGLDREIQQLVMACLAKSPHERPPTAARVATLLDRANRRLAPRFASTAALAEIASAIARTPTALSSSQGHEPGKETTAIPAAAGGLAAATTLVGVAATAAPGAVGVAAGAADTSSWRPPTPAPVRIQPKFERGVVAHRRTRDEEAVSRRSSVAGGLLLALALTIAGGAGILAITRLLEPGEEEAGIGVLPTDPPPTRSASPATSAAVITVPTVATTPVLATLIASPLTPPPSVATLPSPPATPPVTPPPTRRLPPTPPPTSRPRPTAAPEPTPIPPPAATDITVRIPDRRFVGDFQGENDRTYHGRTASWVYGQGTAFHTMTAAFTLDHEGSVIGRASLQIVGLDAENPLRNDVRIVLNGATLYEGPNPLPNDFCCGSSGPGNWGSIVLEFPGSLLARENTLSISNLEPTDCTSCPKFVMLDYAELSYRAR